MKNLLNKLTDYGVRYPSETKLVQKFRAFVDTSPNCFFRNNPPGHLTGSAWIVNLDFSKTLLTHHHKLNNWVQLGGHADGNMNLLQVAIREVVEESGLKDFRPASEHIFDIDIHLVPTLKGETEHFHYDVRFLFIADDSQKLNPGFESLELFWADLDRLEKLTEEESVLKMRSKSIHYSENFP
jgi:8-oxo-dGTP pyrophosphatase MutT (NUDIX family)